MKRVVKWLFAIMLLALTPFDTAGLAHVTQALIDEGFTDGDIAKVMGGNVMRVLAQTLPPR